MKYVKMISIGKALLLLTLLANAASAQLIVSQITTWKEVISSASLSLPDEAGSDLNPILETPANYSQIDVKNVAPDKSWKITVSKRDINWPGAFTPYVQRNSNGTPCATCSGINNGISAVGYIPVTNVEQDFMFGTGEVNGIDLQFKIEGITLAVDAQNYQTEIIYTLYGD